MKYKLPDERESCLDVAGDPDRSRFLRFTSSVLWARRSSLSMRLLRGPLPLDAVAPSLPASD